MIPRPILQSTQSRNSIRMPRSEIRLNRVHDSAYVAGCLFRDVLLCAHALHADAGHWLVNEKGARRHTGRVRLRPIARSLDAMTARTLRPVREHVANGRTTCRTRARPRCLYGRGVPW